MPGFKIFGIEISRKAEKAIAYSLLGLIAFAVIYPVFEVTPEEKAEASRQLSLQFEENRKAGEKLTSCMITTGESAEYCKAKTGYTYKPY